MKKWNSRSGKRFAAFCFSFMLSMGLLMPFVPGGDQGGAAWSAKASELSEEETFGASDANEAWTAGFEDGTVLESALASYEQKVEPNKDSYTKESVRDLEKSVSAAKKILSKKNATAEERKEAWLALEHAMAKLALAEQGPASPYPIQDPEPRAMTDQMGTGISLSDALAVTRAKDLMELTEYLDVLKDLGFRTIRIPVNTEVRLGDPDESHPVDHFWIQQIRTMVDAAAAKDLYVILTLDSVWTEVPSPADTPEAGEPVRTLFPSDLTKTDEVRAWYAGVWKELAAAFKDHDEHVLFESMNHPDTSVASREELLLGQALVSDLNQIFVRVVRATGGNNASRYLVVPGLSSNISWTVKEEYGFAFPEDTAKNRLFVSVKDLSKRAALNSEKTFSSFDAEDVIAMLGQLNHFTSRNIPVLFSEYSCAGIEGDSDRAYYLELVNVLCRKEGIVPILRNEEPSGEKETEGTLIDRKDGSVKSSACVDAMMRGMYGGNSYDVSEVSPDAETKPVGQILILADTERGKWYSTGASIKSDSQGTRLLMAQGECFALRSMVTPAESKEPVVYSSSNESVITVNGGVVRAKGIGTAKVFSSSRDGLVKSELDVIVSKAADAKPCSGIETIDGEVKLLTGESRDLTVRMLPEDSDSTLSFYSIDSEVAYVTPQGRVYAGKPGRTLILITASSGIQTYVPVTVFEPEEQQTLSLAMKLTYQGPSGNFERPTGPAAEKGAEPGTESPADSENDSASENRSDLNSEQASETLAESESLKEETSGEETEESTEKASESGTENQSENETEPASNPENEQQYEVLSVPVTVSEGGVYTITMDSVEYLDLFEAYQGSAGLLQFLSLSLVENAASERNAALLEDLQLQVELVAVYDGQPRTVLSTPVMAGAAGGHFSEMVLKTAGDANGEVAFPDSEGRFPGILQVKIKVVSLRFDLSDRKSSEEEITLKSSSPTSFSMVLGESADISVKMSGEDSDVLSEMPVVFLSSDQAIVWVDNSPKTAGAEGRLFTTVYAKEPGSTTIKAISRDLKVVTFTVKVTREAEVVETGKEPEPTTKAPEKETQATPVVSEPPGSNMLEVVMLAVLLGVIVLFVVIGTAILLKSARNKG